LSQDSENDFCKVAWTWRDEKNFLAPTYTILFLQPVEGTNSLTVIMGIKGKNRRSAFSSNLTTQANFVNQRFIFFASLYFPEKESCN